MQGNLRTNNLLAMPEEIPLARIGIFGHYYAHRNELIVSRVLYQGREVSSSVPDLMLTCHEALYNVHGPINVIHRVFL